MAKRLRTCGDALVYDLNRAAELSNISWNLDVWSSERIGRGVYPCDQKWAITRAFPFVQKRLDPVNESGIPGARRPLRLKFMELRGQRRTHNAPNHQQDIHLPRQRLAQLAPRTSAVSTRHGDCARRMATVSTSRSVLASCGTAGGIPMAQAGGEKCFAPSMLNSAPRLALLRDGAWFETYLRNHVGAGGSPNSLVTGIPIGIKVFIA